jgi:hypothetical protein
MAQHQHQPWATPTSRGNVPLGPSYLQHITARYQLHQCLSSHLKLAVHLSVIWMAPLPPHALHTTPQHSTAQLSTQQGPVSGLSTCPTAHFRDTHRTAPMHHCNATALRAAALAPPQTIFHHATPLSCARLHPHCAWWWFSHRSVRSWSDRLLLLTPRTHACNQVITSCSTAAHACDQVGHQSSSVIRSSDHIQIIRSALIT